MTTDAVTAPRPFWLIHPIQAWRALAALATARADAEARAAGLTVEVLPNGVRRYRDPLLDELADLRASRVDGNGVASDWSPVRLVTAGGDRRGQ